MRKKIMNIKILMLLLIAVSIIGIISPVSATVSSINSETKMFAIEYKEKSVKHKITWNGNGGTIGTKKIVSTTVNNYSKLEKLPKTPKFKGYLFGGWYTKKSGGTKINKNTKPKKSLTYYAHWKVKVYWDANGGKIVAKNNSVTLVYNDTKLGKLPTPKRSGYKFEGWYTKKIGGTKISEKIKPTKSVSYYAQWKDTPENHEKKLKSLIIDDNSVSYAAKEELMRILRIQLQNSEILNSLLKYDVKIVIIPMKMYLTDHPEFKKTDKYYKYHRGISNIQPIIIGGKNSRSLSGGYCRVAIGEENLIGAEPNLIDSSGRKMARYEVGYSVATHEIAHAIHYFTFSDEDYDVLNNRYEETKRDGNWVGGSGCYASFNVVEYFSEMSNAYLGTYTGFTERYDMTFDNAKAKNITGVKIIGKNPCNNGKEWIKNNDIIMYNLLKKVYGDGEVNEIYPNGRLIEGGIRTNPEYPLTNRIISQTVNNAALKVAIGV